MPRGWRYQRVQLGESFNNGYLMFERAQHKLDAHCCIPSHNVNSKCKLDRTTLASASMSQRMQGQGRPLAFLALWLREGHKFATREAHKAAKAELCSNDSHVARLEVRSELGRLANNDPAVREAMETERPLRDEEMLEPLIVP